MKRVFGAFKLTLLLLLAAMVLSGCGGDVAKKITEQVTKDIGVMAACSTQASLVTDVLQLEMNSEDFTHFISLIKTLGLDTPEKLWKDMPADDASYLRLWVDSAYSRIDESSGLSKTKVEVLYNLFAYGLIQSMQAKNLYKEYSFYQVSKKESGKGIKLTLTDSILAGKVSYTDCQRADGKHITVATTQDNTSIQ